MGFLWYRIATASPERGADGFSRTLVEAAAKRESQTVPKASREDSAFLKPRLSPEETQTATPDSAMKTGPLVIENRLEDAHRQSECVVDSKVPQVALMFLSYGKLHNEPVWRAFFEAAGRLCLRHLPPANVTKAMFSLTDPDPFQLPANRTRRLMSDDAERRRLDCSEEQAMLHEEATRLMAPAGNEVDLISQQSFFNVYVNSQGYKETEEPSMFAGKVIDHPLDTQSGYAQFTLVAATLRLIRAGLEEPRNRKFVLLSESCVPIHPPEVIHAQLIAEPRSRLNACRYGNRNYGRWNDKIVDFKYWRKSSQFMALRRSHAALAMNDTKLRNKFRTHCFTTWYPMHNLCVSDEHFFPTLIAYHGFDKQTDCQGYVTSSEWDQWRDPWHPVSYAEEDVNATLFRRLAENGKAQQACEVDKTRGSTSAIYSGFSSSSCRPRDSHLVWSENSTNWLVKKGYYPLLYPCPLFSRKFSSQVVRKTLESALSCNGTGLGYWCY